MASSEERLARIARVTPQGQLQPLHRTADDDARTDRREQATAGRPGAGPVGSITRGEAEGPATGPGSEGPEARKDSDRYRFANFTKAQPLFRCLARLGRDKVIPVSVLSAKGANQQRTESSSSAPTASR